MHVPPRGLNILPLDLVEIRRILQQPRALDFCDIPNESLISRFHDLVEDDPVGFAIL